MPAVEDNAPRNLKLTEVVVAFLSPYTGNAKLLTFK